MALHPAPALAPPQVRLQQGKEAAEGVGIERIVCDIIILLCTWLLRELLLLLLLLLFLGDGELRPLLFLGDGVLRALLLLGDGELRPLLCLIVCWMWGRTNKDDTTAVASACCSFLLVSCTAAGRGTP